MRIAKVFKEVHMPLLQVRGALLAKNSLLGLRDPVDVVGQLIVHLILAPHLEEGRAALHLLSLLGELTAQHAEHQVEHEERAENDERHEVDPVEAVARRVVRVVHHGGPALHRDALEYGQHGVDDVVEAGDAVVGAVPLALETLDLSVLRKVFVGACEGCFCGRDKQKSNKSKNGWDWGMANIRKRFCFNLTFRSGF